MAKIFKPEKIFKSVVSLILLVSIVCLSSFGTVFAARDGQLQFYREDATNLRIMGPTDDPVYYYTPPIDEEGNIDYFYYPLYDTDPMDVSDEFFFGVWNDEEHIWTTAPLFKYSEFEGLAGVEAAAKAGNYELAKEEFLNYYKDVLPGRVSKMTQLSSTNAAVARRVLDNFARNICFNHKDIGNVMRLFTVPYNESSNPEDWEEISIDITANPGVSTFQTYDQFNIQFGSADKFYTQTEICSKESDYPPVLEVRKNGIVVECPVVMDFTLRGGSYSEVNYGTDPVLKVEEHGGRSGSIDRNDTSSSIGHTTDDTYRSMIIFDTSDITSADKVTSVTLKLRARTNQDRYPKEISMEWVKNTAFVENEVSFSDIADHAWWSAADTENWDFWYNRRVGYKGAKSSLWRGYEASRLYQGYVGVDNGKNEAFAYNWLRYVMAGIMAIGCNYECMSSLDMTAWSNKTIEGLSAVMTSEYLTPVRFTTIIKQLYLMADLQVNQFFGLADNNWATYSTGSVYNFIARFPEIRFHDEWLERLRADNARVIGGASFEDGMCIELPFNYVTTLLGTFVELLSTSIETGHETPFTDEALQDCFDTVRTLVYAKGPYGAFNQQDDCSTYSPRTSNYQQWYAYNLFDDPGLTYLATGGAQGYMPEHPTTHYWDGYKTMFRTGWGTNDTMLSFTNQLSNKASHRHKDALSFSMFAYGKFLLVDPGYGVITSDGWKEYNGSPVQHNLVTVNDIEDFLTTGTNTSYDTIEYGEGSYQMGFESNMIHDFKEYGTTAYKTNQDARRSIFFQREDNFFIVTDYLIPNDTNQQNLYAQHWHFYPGAQFSYDENTFALQTNIVDEPNVKVVPVEYEEVDEVRRVRTTYSELSGSLVNSEKGMILKTKAGLGRFTTVIVPTNIGEEIDVETRAIETDYDPDIVNAATIRIKNNSTGEENMYYYFHLNEESQKLESVRLGDFVTDASTMFVKLTTTGEIVSGFIMNGSYIKNVNINGAYVIKTEEQVDSLSFAKRGSIMNLASSSMSQEDIEAMTVYSFGASTATFQTCDWDRVITSKMEQAPLNVSKQGGYFYFGDEPVVDVEDTEEDEEEREEGDRDGAVGGMPTTNPGNQGTQDGAAGVGGAGGGGAGGGTPATDPKDETKPSKDVVYKDVKTSDWYYNDVKELSANGIVSGNGDGKFMPADKVTREQFLKMIIEASGIKAEAGINTFEDVPPDAWYASYVKMGQKTGIITGITDTLFGIGNGITRQDMAVMLDRTLTVLDPEIDIAADVEKFADTDDVSAYASDAVHAMKSIGLINGYENMFRPKDTLTRAEAATVINNFFKMLAKAAQKK